LGTLGVAVSNYFYYVAIQRTNVATAIIASCREPVFSILLAALLLGEILRPIQMLGIAFVLAAIVIVQRPAQGVLVEPIE
jgi:probable blue pigment (indigoidine) exporter